MIWPDFPPRLRIIYWYCLVAVDKAGKSSEPSEILCNQAIDTRVPMLLTHRLNTAWDEVQGGVRIHWPSTEADIVCEARRDPAWGVLRTIPYLGPVRVALLLATMQTPWRFRTKRNLWAYAGLAVVTHSSAEHDFVAGRAVRRRRAPLTRGLNKNHNRILKDISKGAALAAIGRPGSLRDFYEGMLARGMRPELARVTLARKLAALTLRLWKRRERYDPTKLTLQAT
jgi:hypothetical protein